jgi:hypothetical protein
VVGGNRPTAKLVAALVVGGVLALAPAVAAHASGATYVDAICQRPWLSETVTFGGYGEFYAAPVVHPGSQHHVGATLWYQDRELRATVHREHSSNVIRATDMFWPVFGGRHFNIDASAYTYGGAFLYDRCWVT